MRERKYKSKKDELLKKSREAMLTATNVYNNPLIQFKSETFITLAIIAWTYLLHAYYEGKNIDYCFFKQKGKRKQYDLTKYGARKHWDLETCLDKSDSPIDNATKENLKFLIGIRHEIEHQMTSNIDEFIGAKLQACVLNFNHYIKTLFGAKYSLDKELSLSISISEIDPTSAKVKKQGINTNVQRFIAEFENGLDASVSNDKRYTYKILYLPVNANHKGQADKIIEFVKLTPEQEEKIKDIVVFKDREKPKYKPKRIVELMKKEGYKNFSIYKHTLIWQEMERKGVDLTQYKTKMSDGSVYWYENWVEYVKLYCAQNKTKYS